MAEYKYNLFGANIFVPFATTESGSVTTNVTGNLTGDVTGDVTGNLTGDLAGAPNYATTGGSANAYTLDLSGLFTAFADGNIIVFKAHAASTDAATINVDSVGVKKLYKGSDNSTQVGNTDLAANGIYMAIYNSSLDTASGGWVVQSL